jgi:ParB-like chromosome segregation protein Spo0J
MIEITVKKVKLSTIRLNPDNPRRISKKNTGRLVKSLQDFPEMLELREIIIDENNIILGGNMRYRALKQIGEKECVAKIVKGLTRDQKRKFIVKDNGSFGEWDFDLLANGFDDLPLAEFGVDIPKSWGEDPVITEDVSEPKSNIQQNECPKCGFKWKSNDAIL